MYKYVLVHPSARPQMDNFERWQIRAIDNVPRRMGWYMHVYRLSPSALASRNIWSNMPKPKREVIHRAGFFALEMQQGTSIELVVKKEHCYVARLTFAGEKLFKVCTLHNYKGVSIIIDRGSYPRGRAGWCRTCQSWPSTSRTTFVMTIIKISRLNSKNKISTFIHEWDCLGCRLINVNDNLDLARATDTCRIYNYMNNPTGGLTKT